jgi:arabinogalactan endo-1,4-beta-galactosidase
MVRSRNIVVAAIAMVVLCNVAAIVATSFHLENRVSAAQKFTPETVKSVPESFLKGGDRSLAVLVEINGTLLENGRKLDKIAEKLDKVNANLTRLLTEN